LFKEALAPPPGVVVDLGCGTGSVSVLLAEMGYDVRGFDFSPAMVEAAQAKAIKHGCDVAFELADITDPSLARASVDAIVVRHVVWTLLSPGEAIKRWMSALRPNGRAILVEGRWWTGAGMPSGDLLNLVKPHAATLEVRELSNQSFWGRPIHDERYAVIARL
jgi:SAM-dependent methyltransferase